METTNATDKPETAGARAMKALKDALKSSIKTILFLLKIMVPVSLGVSLFAWLGALEVVAAWFKPVMSLVGLPGDAAIALITGAFLTNYSAIAAMNALGTIGLREATIIAIMCLTAHNLIVETAVMKKAGSSSIKMAALRLGASFVMGFLFNLVLPRDMGAYASGAEAAAVRPEFLAMLAAWAVSTFWLFVKIIVLVVLIMVAQAFMKEFKVAQLLSKLFAPLMTVFGLPGKTSFLWIVVNIVGYAYGAAVITDEIERGGMTKTEADLFNHHAAMSHSQFEDTFLYVAVGVPVLWITLPRLALAIVVVWLERARRSLFRASFRVGTH